MSPSNTTSGTIHCWNPHKGPILSLVQDQNRVSLFDSSSASTTTTTSSTLLQDLKLPFHLSTIYTSTCWNRYVTLLDDSTSKHMKKKSRTETTSHASPYLALGTHDGRVIVWNTTRGEVSREVALPGRNDDDDAIMSASTSSMNVTALDFINSTQMLVATETAIYLCNPFQLQKKGGAGGNAAQTEKIFPLAQHRQQHSTQSSAFASVAASMASNAANVGRYFAVGTVSGASTYLFESTSKQIEHHLLGHSSATGTTHLKFLGEEYLVSASSSDRHIYLFHLPGISSSTMTSGKTNSSMIEPLHVLTADAPPVSVDIRYGELQEENGAMNSEKKQKKRSQTILEIAVVSQNGNCHVFRVGVRSKKGAAGGGKKKRRRSSSTNALGDGVSTVKAKLTQSSVVQLSGGDGKSSNNFFGAVFDVITGELVMAYGLAQFHRLSTEELFAKELIELTAHVPKIDKYKGEKNQSTRPKSRENAGVILTQVNMQTADARLQHAFGKQDSATLRANGVSLEERIADLDTSQFMNKAADNHKVPEMEFTSSLIQAIKSQDKAMISQCLAQSDVDLIRITIRKLPTQFTVSLLEAILEQYQDFHKNNSHLVHWIRAILVLHTAHIMSQPTILHKLSPFYHSITQRLASFPKLLDLSGRLDLLLSLAGHGLVDTEVEDIDIEEETQELNNHVIEDLDSDDEDNLAVVEQVDSEDEVEKGDEDVLQDVFSATGKFTLRGGIRDDADEDGNDVDNEEAALENLMNGGIESDEDDDDEGFTFGNDEDDEISEDDDMEEKDDGDGDEEMED